MNHSPPLSLGAKPWQVLFTILATILVQVFTWLAFSVESKLYFLTITSGVSSALLFLSHGAQATFLGALATVLIRLLQLGGVVVCELRVEGGGPEVSKSFGATHRCLQLQSQALVVVCGNAFTSLFLTMLILHPPCGFPKRSNLTFHSSSQRYGSPRHSYHATHSPLQRSDDGFILELITNIAQPVAIMVKR